MSSLPLWERGLKSIYEVLVTSLDSVAPLVGAWIEIRAVALLVTYTLPSLPLWERGLKYISPFQKARYRVAPLVGAWIEMFLI